MTTPGNWGRWGGEDEVGAANLLDAEVVAGAASLVREGRVLGLAQPLSRATPTPSHRLRPAHFMDRDGADSAPDAEFGFADDTWLLAGHAGTHVDALAHVWSKGSLYNGFDAGSVTSRGARRCSIDRLPPLVGRGVLLDVAALLGPLPAGHEVTVDELQGALEATGTVLRPGDLVLLRTGWWEHAGAGPGYFEGEPGPGAAGAAWLAAADVALVGADNYALEVQPERTFPAHRILLRDHGVPILEGLDLTELAACGRPEFLLVVAPLPLVGGSGSPVAPVVLL